MADQASWAASRGGAEGAGAGQAAHRCFLFPCRPRGPSSVSWLCSAGEHMQGGASSGWPWRLVRTRNSRERMLASLTAMRRASGLPPQRGSMRALWDLCRPGWLAGSAGEQVRKLMEAPPVALSPLAATTRPSRRLSARAASGGTRMWAWASAPPRRPSRVRCMQDAAAGAHVCRATHMHGTTRCARPESAPSRSCPLLHPGQPIGWHAAAKEEQRGDFSSSWQLEGAAGSGSVAAMRPAAAS